MTVYPIAGSAQTLAADSVESAAGVAVPGSGGYPDGENGGGLEVRSSRSVTKDGTVRLLVEASENAILETGATTMETLVSPIKVHTVVTVPKAAMAVFSREAARGASTGTLLGNLNYLVGILYAILTNQSPTDLPTVVYSSVIARGLLGSRPVDTVNGVYGSES